MSDFPCELDLFPQLGNRSVLILTPTKLFVDWMYYILDDINYNSINNLETVSFLVKDFDTQDEFSDWLKCNYQILFDIRLNYACLDKTKWPENRTYEVFMSWFDIKQSNLILDLVDESILFW